MERDRLKEIAADPALTPHLGPADLAAAFDLDHHLRHVDAIFQRVFGEEEAE